MTDGTTPTARLLPEQWRLSIVARELRVHAHTLVEASRDGRFPPLVRVGRCWFVDAAAVRDWFSRQHVVTPDPLRLQAIQAYVRAGGAPLPARRRRGAP